MLNERQIELLPERIYQRLNDINSEYLTNIGTVIKKIGELRPTDVHQLQRMYNYGSDMHRITYKLAEATQKNTQEIYDIFDVVAQENYNFSKPFYEAKAKQFIPYEENEQLQKYVKSIAKQTVNDYVNLTQHTAFAVFDKDGKSIAPLFASNKDKVATSLSDTYTKVIDYAVTKVQLGVDNYNNAMREVMEAMAKSGIRTVDYATGYSRRLDTSVRQNVLWGVKQCNQNTADMIGEDFGADGYEISYHSHPRPSHEEMGGKQYAIGKGRTVNGVCYPPFSDVEHLLEEYNCLHFKFSILLGISSPAYDKSQLDELKASDRQKFTFEGEEYTMYEGSQLQRKIETAIRNQKDRANIAKAAGKDEMRREAQEKINLLTNKYAALSNASGLPTKMERMQVKGFRSVKVELNGNQALNDARFSEMITNWPAFKGDVINPRNIQKELNKSEVGKKAIEFIINNGTTVDIYYDLENTPKGKRGVSCGNHIEIYALNTKTVKCTAETIIHEVTHIERNINNCQWAEAVCFCQERKHTKNKLTMMDLRDIIKKVKELYPDLKWR